MYDMVYALCQINKSTSEFVLFVFIKILFITNCVISKHVIPIAHKMVITRYIHTGPETVYAFRISLYGGHFC
jgi:hypothetical protein